MEEKVTKIYEEFKTILEGSKMPLKEKYFEKPSFKFIYHLVRETRKKTSFPPDQLFGEDDDIKALTDNELKGNFLTKVIRLVYMVTKKKLPEKIPHIISGILDRTGIETTLDLLFLFVEASQKDVNLEKLSAAYERAMEKMQRKKEHEHKEQGGDAGEDREGEERKKKEAEEAKRRAEEERKRKIEEENQKIRREEEEAARNEEARQEEEQRRERERMEMEEQQEREEREEREKERR
ncbi:hypothetical protein ADUPG1_000365, partial [Aduncisulcus paluster]